MKGHKNNRKQCKNDAKHCKMTRNNGKTTQNNAMYPPKIKDFNIKFESFIDEFYKYDTFYSKLLFITHVYHSKQLFMFLYFGGGGNNQNTN